MHEIARFAASVQILRQSLSKELPSQQIVLFLTVVQRPGITMPELCRQLNMPQGSVSRNIKALSDYAERVGGVLVPKGYGLVRTEPDRFNPHCLAVYPTAKGQRLAQSLAAALGQFPARQDGREGRLGAPASGVGEFRGTGGTGTILPRDEAGGWASV